RAAGRRQPGRLGEPRHAGQLPRTGRGLSVGLSEFARQRGAGDRAVPADRLPARLGDRPRAEPVAAAIAVPGDIAVLDRFSDPGLCLDRIIAAERADQPAIARIGADRDAVAALVQRLLSRARARLFLPAVYDIAALWQPGAAR